MAEHSRERVTELLPLQKNRQHYFFSAPAHDQVLLLHKPAVHMVDVEQRADAHLNQGHSLRRDCLLPAQIA